MVKKFLEFINENLNDFHNQKISMEQYNQYLRYDSMRLSEEEYKHMKELLTSKFPYTMVMTHEHYDWRKSDWSRGTKNNPSYIQFVLNKTKLSKDIISVFGYITKLKDDFFLIYLSAQSKGYRHEANFKCDEISGVFCLLNKLTNHISLSEFNLLKESNSDVHNKELPYMEWNNLLKSNSVDFTDNQIRYFYKFLTDRYKINFIKISKLSWANRQTCNSESSNSLTINFSPDNKNNSNTITIVQLKDNWYLLAVPIIDLHNKSNKNSSVLYYKCDDVVGITTILDNVLKKK